jgi:hypothetical protein
LRSCIIVGSTGAIEVHENGVVVAIHQPNFYPWLGYFDKIARADRFVVLDDAQFSRGGGTWSNRVRCLVGGKAHWVTAPLARDSRDAAAQVEVRFASNLDWRAKIARTIEQSYARAPSFKEAFDLLEPLLKDPDDRLADYNMKAIVAIASALGLDAEKIVRSSSLDVASTGTERLIALTKATGGSVYLCGGGAGGYQEDELFTARGVELRYQDFTPSAYPQVGSPGEFVAGLSIIDALCNLGVEETRSLLLSSRPQGAH